VVCLGWTLHLQKKPSAAVNLKTTVESRPRSFLVIAHNGIDVGLGTQFTINDRPDTLDRYYGADLGYAFQFFLRIRPSLHSHGAHEHAERVAGTQK
jgi:hypothetical protein